MLTILVGAATVSAQVQLIRVGDIDGFGIGDGGGLLNFQGDPVNVDGLGVLASGDYLPDWDQDGLVQDFHGDDFELRSPDEIAGMSIATIGFEDVASFGSEFTDLSLSQSYDTTFELPNDFPDPPSTNRNDAFFTFEFEIAVTDIEPGTPVFLNIVFGDIGALPAELTLTYADGSSEMQKIPPIDPDTEDGRIAASFATLDFDNVFTEAGDHYDGFVEVLLVTRPNVSGGDPYYAIDYVELSTEKIDTCPADIDMNGAVDFGDLLAILSAWGPCSGCPEDLDGDANVGFGDILVVLSSWGPCKP